ncbi:MAG: hypothetical protein JOZ45_13835 [Acidobacteriaceae bacterium]|nr:hypothetical protein [Acidobacteriaceae bacterium]MBV9307222.1 hypothetical protein [Acidobacteriaceae bacterium]MBV9937983.1 hypothetical protein [Acidobacteriaceae bacterium]
MHQLKWNSSMVLALLAAPLLAIASDQPNFSGTWKLDPARSPGVNGATITLNIKDEAGKISYERTVKQTDGKQTAAHFTCSPGGSNCDFDENGHKAKVSLWYDGSALMILKTGGPKQDATTERKLELSADGNTLKVQFMNLDLDKSDKPETLVFTKQPNSAASAQ